ncbi:hypothetical protein B0H13DRAFT_1867054 [Mycena leptocephala]|nr:hypothetical protein B0H13DRAFT_1867054 [Mycena leptocephala]
MVVKLTDQEVDGSRLFKCKEETDQSMVKLEKVKLSTHIAFYAEARARISLPRGLEISAILGEVVVPAALHKTTTSIVGQRSLGIRDFTEPGFKPTPFPKNQCTCLYAY